MAKKITKDVKYRCRDCKHSYNYFEIGANGKPFLCRCPYEKWAKFLNDPACDKFGLRVK
jgi:hypothetical protein